MPAKGHVILDGLPEELHLQILQFCNHPPAAQQHFWEEPSLKSGPQNASLVLAKHQPLKNLSLVSRAWRRRTLPLLFSCLRIRLDLGEMRNRKSAGDEDAYTAGLDQALNTIKDLVDRVGDCQKVQSVPILAESSTNDGRNGMGRPLKDLMPWSDTFVQFWACFFTIFNPPLVTLIAKEFDMILIANISTKRRCFPSTDTGILQLRQGRDFEWNTTQHSSLKSVPQSPQRSCANRSLLEMRPWTHVGINAGSDPNPRESSALSRIASVSNEVFQAMEKYADSISPSTKGTEQFVFPTHVRSLSYSLSCVHKSGLDISAVLEVVEHLELSFAGGPQSTHHEEALRLECLDPVQNVYDSACRAYRELAGALQTIRVPASGLKGKTKDSWTLQNERIKVRKLVVRDMGSPIIGEKLERIFVSLHLPVWAEYEKGVFTRLINLPNEKLS